jgi:hypothetical protein
VVAPEPVVMAWDFGDDVPVPGAEHRGYARFTDTAGWGCRVQVDQLVETAEQAAFMQRAWGFVLGRLAAGTALLRAGGPAGPPVPHRRYAGQPPARGVYLCDPDPRSAPTACWSRRSQAAASAR